MAMLRRMTAAGALEAEIPLDRAELTLGRGQECDVVIGEKLVSRRHAKIVRTTSGSHVLLDEASNIGVMMGETKVTHRELREGDVFQIGLTKFQYVAGASAKAKAKGGGKGWVVVAIVVVLLVLGGAAAALLLLGKKDVSRASTTAASSEPAPLGGGAFARTGRELAAKVAALHRAEQAALAHVPGKDVSQLDADLTAVALAAIDAGRTARQLADTVAVQPGGDVGRVAWEQYQGAAKAAYGAALSAETARAQLRTEPLVLEALPNILAGIGARLSSGEVDAAWADAPPLTDVPVPDGAAGGTWMSTTADTIGVEIFVPPDVAGTPRVREVIGALAALGAEVDRDGVVISMFAGISVMGAIDDAVKTVKSYVPGKVTQVVKEVENEATKVVINDFLEGAGNPLIKTAPPVTVAVTPPPSVGIVIGRVNRPSDATGKVQIDVSWTTPGPDELTIVCQLPGYGSVEAVGKGSGKARVEITMSGAPAGETLSVACFAKDGRGVTVGWKEVQVDPQHDPLVDAAVPDGGAPVAVIDATPPPPPPPPAPDAAVGDAWIEPYVKAIEADLLAKRPGDEVAIAIVTSDLRTCLVAAVADGLGEQAAKAACAKALKEGKEYQPGGVEVPVAAGWPGVYNGTLTARYTVKGKSRTIGVAQILTITQQGETLTVVDKEGEAVKLTIAADGSASGKMEVEHVVSTVTLTLQAGAVVLNGKFVDDEGGSGTMSGTLTRQ